MNWNAFQVYLRAFELNDCHETIKWRRDDEIWNMAGSPKYFVSTENEKKWIENAIFLHDQIRLAICLKDNDKLVGVEILKDIDNINRSAQWGYLIGDRSLWGRGIGTEAGLLFLKYVFQERGFNRIWALVNQGNIASKRILEKCGLQKEGHLRESIYKQGMFQNQLLYSILREDFDALLSGSA